MKDRYAIYTYEAGAALKTGDSDRDSSADTCAPAKPAEWRMNRTRRQKLIAMRDASRLFKSGAYERVEVKRLYFDPSSACRRDKTLKIFENRPMRKRIVLLFGVIAGLTALAAYEIVKYL